MTTTTVRRPRARRGRHKTTEKHHLFRTFIAAQTSAARSWTRRLIFVVAIDMSERVVGFATPAANRRLPPSRGLR